MRIGIDGRYIQDQYHGIGRYTYELILKLAEGQPQHEFVVFYNPAYANNRFNIKRFGEFKNISLIKTGLKLFRLQQQFVWPRLIRQHQIDLFHSPYFDGPWLPTRCTTFITIHDLIFDRYPAFMPKRYMWPIYHLLTRLNIWRSDHILAVSEATKQDIVELYGVPASDVSITYGAVAPSFAPVSQSKINKFREKYRLPEKFVLTVGTFRPQKNVATLIKAFALIADRCDVQLVLAGKPDSRWEDPVTPLIQSLGLQDRVMLLDHIAEDDLPTLYSAATLFAFPSIIEGFGLPPLEAMACGTAVVTSNTTSLPEVVGNAGITVDPHSPEELSKALFRCLTDQAYRQQLEEKGLVRAAQFNWGRTAQQTMQSYARVQPNLIGTLAIS